MSWGGGRERVISSLQSLQGWALAALVRIPGLKVQCCALGKAGGQQKLACALPSFPGVPLLLHTSVFSFILTDKTLSLTDSFNKHLMNRNHGRRVLSTHETKP